MITSRLDRRAARAATLALPLLFLGLPAPAQPQEGQPRGEEAWQRQQPTQERARDLARQEGVAASPAERRQELRTLNEVHREIMPPGTTVPAPRVAPEGRAAD